MFDELSSETLRNVTGGFRVDPEIVNAMLSTLQRITSARDAMLASLNNSVTQMMFLLAAQSRRAREVGMAPTGIAPIAPGTPMPFGAPAMDSTFPPPSP